MKRVDAETTVNVPPHVVYEHWTRFESFPAFLPWVDEVTRTSENQLHWVESPGGVKREYLVRITEQTPGQTLAWERLDSPDHWGRVVLEPINEGTTKVRLVLTFSDEGPGEGGTLLTQAGVMRPNLKRFRDRVERVEMPRESWSRGDDPNE